MANFIIVGGEPSGFGSKTIKIKPNSVNTSETTEKKGKLVIKVNGEVQRTISLSQAVKTSTPETPGTVTLVSREIALTFQEISTSSITNFTEVNTNTNLTANTNVLKSRTINKNFTRNSKNDSNLAKVTYSVRGIQTDYLSDGSSVKTYLYPEINPNNSDLNWNMSYPKKPEGNTLLINFALNITSAVVLSSLPTTSRLNFSFNLSDVKTNKADVSYDMLLTVKCTLIITVKTVDIFRPIEPSNPDLKPIDPDIDPNSDDPIYVIE